MSNLVGELPPNWLSEIFREARKIDRIIPIVEQMAERNCVVEKIKSEPKGARFASHPNLSEAVFAALGVANDVERRQKRQPMPGPGPNTSAAIFLADELNEPLD